MADVYLQGFIGLNIASVEYSFGSDQPLQSDMQFKTGAIDDMGAPSQPWVAQFGTANGTILSSDANPANTVLSVNSVTGFVVNDPIRVLLDNGNEFWSVISEVGGSTVTMTDPITSIATTGNNVVALSQLQDTTDVTLATDFKRPKSNIIKNRSIALLEDGFQYNGITFPYVGSTEPNSRLLRLYVDRMRDIGTSNTVSVINGITRANPGVMTVVGLGDIVEWSTIEIATVVGMTEINGQQLTARNISGLSFELYQFGGLVPLDTSGYSLYVAGGTATKLDNSTNQPVLTQTTIPYVIVDNEDFDAVRVQAELRRAQIFGFVSGEGFLLRQVALANNTLSAMNAIVDNRT